MLLELHVRNFALIEKADLELSGGLTVLSGETGAGKSVLIDSIELALGAKGGKDLIRTGADAAYIELIFSEERAERLEKIRALGIEPDEDGIFIVSRKISENRSVMRVNDEAVTVRTLRDLTGLLIDIHGQHEHQTLMHPSMHLRFIDLMSAPRAKELKAETAAAWRDYAALAAQLKSGSDGPMRRREAEILRYETEEIAKADLAEGEEEKLRAEYARIRNAARITEALSDAAEALDTDAVSRAYRDAAEVAGFDPKIREIAGQISELDGLLSDARRNIADYSEDLQYDEARFNELNARLDLIHRLQDKYGNDISSILKQCAEKKKRLEFLEHFEEKQEELQREMQKLRDRLDRLCDELSAERQQTAESLKHQIRGQLSSLNFTGAKFDIAFTRLPEPGPNGRDGAEFLISTNPGEPLKPLKDVASGGELSRIMLAMKTVLADTDEIETLIFDEIDAGISGRTAQKVSEKLSLIGRKHQVLCITHLPQIASMADHHYLIRKSTDGQKTRTEVSLIEGDGITEELARLIGGTEITPAVRKTAEEMKNLANGIKQKLTSAV